MTEAVNKNYIPRNVVAFVIRDMVGAAPALVANIKDLIEQRVRQITGLSVSFTIDEQFKQVHESPDPEMSFPEQEGKPVQGTFEEWARVIATGGEINHNTSIDVMFVEMGSDNATVVDAWRVSSLYPRRFSGTDGSKQADSLPHAKTTDITAVSDVSVQFGGILARGPNILGQAQTIADERRVAV